MRSSSLPFALSIGLATLALAMVLEPAEAHAAEPPAGGVAIGGSASASSDDGVAAEVSASAEGSGSSGDDQRWIDKFAPEPNMIELGIYGGVFFPSKSLELFEADLDLPNQGRKPYSLLAPDVGVRIGYYPLRFLGIEAEGGVMPGSLEDGSGVMMWHGRGHLVGQLGYWRLTPFIVAGAGAIGVNSPRAAVGSEADIAVHFGGGLKFFINYWLMMRLDVRDNLTNRVGVSEGVTHSPEVLLGLSVTLNRKKEKPLRDRDGDGIPDRDDQCPREPGPAPTG
ncbi:MAG: hypothetical protein KC457_31540, partial [Myxococcales bacterium]|nr:hypothetical protein [Myxococcales bacterium]